MKNKFKKLSVVIFEPKWSKEGKELSLKHPLKYGEQVVYLGDIPNAIGHCVVLKHSGEAVWLVHPEDFRLTKDDEL